MPERTISLNRKTTETQVSITLNLDGTGQAKLDTGNGGLDHLLAQLCRHGLLDLKISAKGDHLLTGWHHTVEDTAILLGRAFREAVGDGTGIRRMGWALVPLDEALAQVALDVSGRGYAVVELGVSGESIGDLSSELVRHFLHSFAVEARVTLHVKILSGVNSHHTAEAAFKALAKALRQAVEPDSRAAKQVPSTKGTISN